jgi:hypothetical protein
MPIEIDGSEIELAASQVESWEDGISDAAHRGGRNSVYDDIEDVVDSNMEGPVLQAAQQKAKPHIGSERLGYIRPANGFWSSRGVYRSGLTSDNEIVLSHEGGSGSYTSSGPYKIRPDTDEYLMFNQSSGGIAQVEYVIHPGVRGKEFMSRSVRQHSEKIAREVRSRALDTVVDAMEQ